MRINRFHLDLSEGDVRVVDRLLTRDVFVMHPPYDSMLCLELAEDVVNITRLVEWMNSLGEEALLSEGIPSDPADLPC
jgi:hypothetical protein